MQHRGAGASTETDPVAHVRRHDRFQYEMMPPAQAAAINGVDLYQDNRQSFDSRAIVIVGFRRLDTVQSSVSGKFEVDMRNLFLVIPIFLIVIVASAHPGELSKVDDELFDRFAEKRNVARFLPSGSVIGGNLILLGDEWYTLNATEISAIRTLLADGKRYVKQGLPPQRPLATIKLVLWGIVDGTIKPLNVLYVDEEVRIFLPCDGKAGSIHVEDSKERKCLQNLIKRVLDGKDPPIVANQVIGRVEKMGKSSSTSKKTQPNAR
jgi:hypothetical protein